MYHRTTTFLALIVGAVCVLSIIRLYFFIDLSLRTAQRDAVQGFLIGSRVA
jgi:hypothetical protein